MDSDPIFFDPKGKRGIRFSRVAAVFGLMVAVLTTAFLISIFIVLPTLPSLSAGPNRTLLPGLPVQGGRRADFLTSKVRKQLADEITITQKKFKRPVRHPSKIVAAFYAPWEESGVVSLRQNAAKLTHVVPQWLALGKDGKSIDYSMFDINDNPKNGDVVRIARENGIRISPIFGNVQNETADPVRVHSLLGSTAIQKAIAHELRLWLVKNDFQGINIDFEDLAEGDPQKVPAFLHILHNEFQPYSLGVSIDIQAADDELPMAEVADVCDWAVLMAYDQHEATTLPGTICDIDWSQEFVERALKYIPEEKLVLGIGNYAYDWVEGKKGATSLTYSEALATANGYREEAPGKVIKFDDDSLTNTFAYRDDNEVRHQVWMLDAVSAYNQWAAARDYGIRGVALWALGEEDPSVWRVLDKNTLDKPLDAKVLETVDFPNDLSYTGKGEILTVKERPVQGRRTIEVDPDSGLIVGSEYEKYAFPFLLQKSGFAPKKLVLTFDDGPDANYTAPILDELKRLDVPATFFVIGKNARANPGLVSRAYDEGHEIGSHTFTHPNMGEVSDWRQKLELEATQRAIESIIERSTILYRPPYNADSQPNNAEQVRPVTFADSLHYLCVMENVDPTDWDLAVPLPGGGTRRKTAQDIADFVIKDVHRRAGTEDEGNMILLHDAGGDRTETAKALALFVPKLQAEGYEFVTVAKLLGKTRAQVMPPVREQDRFLILLDKIVFGAIFGADSFLAIAFILAIALGLARILMITPLALIYSRKQKGLVFPTGPALSVTALIAAYNEESVIVRTVQSVLNSDYPIDDILIIDDGSKDGTVQAVLETFVNEPRVRLISQPNGGKATALNTGILQAKGDILFCIDADTQLAPDAVRLLVRHFHDPKVGAVAGNVRVGNQINLLTKWQAIEYTTSQNLDRRAYALLNSITVVPGAIGAWRKSAVEQVGGYLTDTLAEDMDLTWRLRRAGWKQENESAAYAYTEAPETFRAFFKQRFRWAYGTLQCLWKHRKALFRYGWFGGLALPALWLFQIVFQALAPLVDLQVVVSIIGVITAMFEKSNTTTTHEIQAMPAAYQALIQVGFLYALFFVVELLSAVIAYRMEKQKPSALFWLFLQRFYYRQIMYGVVIKSFFRAIYGNRQGWGKLERKGTVSVPQPRT